VTRFEVVRDPLWDNIRLDPEALAVVDTPAVQRLRYVRPAGARVPRLSGRHTQPFRAPRSRVHLARRALSQLEDAGDVRLDAADRVA